MGRWARPRRRTRRRRRRRARRWRWGLLRPWAWRWRRWWWGRWWLWAWVWRRVRAWRRWARRRRAWRGWQGQMAAVPERGEVGLGPRGHQLGKRRVVVAAQQLIGARLVRRLHTRRCATARALVRALGGRAAVAVDLDAVAAAKPLEAFGVAAVEGRRDAPAPRDGLLELQVTHEACVPVGLVLELEDRVVHAVRHPTLLGLQRKVLVDRPVRCRHQRAHQGTEAVRGADEARRPLGRHRVAHDLVEVRREQPRERVAHDHVARESLATR